MLKRFIILLIAITACVGCDQQTKLWATQSLAPGQWHSFLNGVFQLVLVENHGVFLSLGNGLPESVKHTVLVTLVSVALLIAIGWLSHRSQLSTMTRIAGVLFISGGLGNVIDRAFNQGGVIDFMYLSCGPIHTGIFNVADIFIMLAAALMLISLLKNDTSPSHYPR